MLAIKFSLFAGYLSGDHIHARTTMDNGMNYYPHHIGDYLRDTAHLTATEDGIYRRLLDLYYASEKPLPLEFDWLCKLVRARESTEREAVKEILQQYWEKRETGWSNNRADEEIRKARKRIKAAKHNGKVGGRPKTQWVSKTNPDGSKDANPDQSSHKPIPIPNTQNQKEDRGAQRSRGSRLPHCLGAFGDFESLGLQGKTRP
jgi:uncharacterized protein YdaU (DUF1376 family)